MQVELYELNGVTDYITDGENETALIMLNPQRAYKNNMNRYPKNVLPAKLKSTENYEKLPIIPFYANNYHRSTFTEPVKTKIDAFDRIMSVFDNNLDRANDIYWVLENFGGDKDDVLAMIADINEIKATYAIGNKGHKKSIESNKRQGEFNLKKTEKIISPVNMGYLNNHANRKRIMIKIIPYCHVEESELDEMWSFVGSKNNQRWLWLAIDHNSRKIIAFAFGRRIQSVFRKLKKLL